MRCRDQNHHKSCNNGGKRKWAKSTAGYTSHGFSENACYPHKQGLARCVAVECHSQAQIARAMFFQSIKRVCINHRVRAHCQGQIVTAEFALVPDPGADPPYSRVEKEKC